MNLLQFGSSEIRSSTLNKQKKLNQQNIYMPSIFFSTLGIFMDASLFCISSVVIRRAIARPALWVSNTEIQPQFSQEAPTAQTGRSLLLCWFLCASIFLISFYFILSHYTYQLQRHHFQFDCTCLSSISILGQQIGMLFHLSVGNEVR